ncbi:unnamed protein product [Periconia digitata]|uniref:Uncharacterized protein n=1 Tax=Periconia digitata TaxID=1303443 RepID=A0A9W4XN17_9PLEO|nr:unnamed protein product [Periconia digitata]
MYMFHLPITTCAMYIPHLSARWNKESDKPRHMPGTCPHHATMTCNVLGQFAWESHPIHTRLASRPRSVCRENHSPSPVKRTRCTAADVAMPGAGRLCVFPSLARSFLPTCPTSTTSHSPALLPRPAIKRNFFCIKLSCRQYSSCLSRNPKPHK